jgi:DNA-binding MarR family transcriptional regulator
MTAQDTSTRIWQGMRALVLDDERRGEVSEALGMSFARVKALRSLTEGPTTMRGLAERLFTDAPYTTLIVNDLEERGLVRRTVSPGDRRAKLVAVTEEGERAAAVAAKILNRPPAHFLDLAQEDLAVLDRLITRLLERGGRAG